MIDGHGDDIWRYGGKVIHNFSTNIHAAFDHSRLMKKLCEDKDTICSYPEPEPISVERKIAALHSCTSDEVMVSNGATESIYLIAKEFSGSKTSIIVPAFREYQDACQMHIHQITFLKTLEEMTKECELVWICNPNNPTGKVTDKELLLDIIIRYPDTVFVIDQAYSDYTSLPVLTAGDAIRAGNVILLGSLTKRFGVPGLRIGYSIGIRDTINRIKRWRMPWSVNGLAINGANYLLSHIDNYTLDYSTLHLEAIRISEQLKELGIKVWDTDCNFILCQLPKGTAEELKQYLIDNAGILIRDASNFESLDKTYFRIAAQSHLANDLLIDNIRQWLNI